MEMIADIILDTAIDGLKLLPFLFVTYCAMELLEHHTEDRAGEFVRKAGKFGPFIGGVFGVVPQCGFSAAASSLYAGRVITLGTLIAIYLSTSDEMVPLLISEQFPVPDMIKILVTKAVIGILAGFIIDGTLTVLRKRNGRNADSIRIDELCRRENCHCEDLNPHIQAHSSSEASDSTVPQRPSQVKLPDREAINRAKGTAAHAHHHSAWTGILKSALVHTVHVFLFILLITLILNTMIEVIGEDRLTALLTGNFILSHILAGVIGLIPNCGASVIITELYVGELISLGTLFSGLLTGAGVGLLVLFRTNTDRNENFRIAFLLFLIGVTAGILYDLVI